MPTLSVRLSDDDSKTLDRLVIAVRAYYQNQAADFPVAERLSREVTRSSALRDLLSAWEHGITDEFKRELTEPIGDGEQDEG